MLDKKVSLGIFGIGGEAAESGVLIRGAGSVVFYEFYEVWILVMSLKCGYEFALSFYFDPLIVPGVEGLKRDFWP